MIQRPIVIDKQTRYGSMTIIIIIYCLLSYKQVYGFDTDLVILYETEWIDKITC